MQGTDEPTLFRLASKGLLLTVFILLAGCVLAPPPYEEYALAYTAIQAAKEVDAARYSMGTWHRAEEAYRNGQVAYKEREFDKAKRFFQLAIRYAERAENATRIKKFKSGDGFP